MTASCRWMGAGFLSAREVAENEENAASLLSKQDAGPLVSGCPACEFGPHTFHSGRRSSRLAERLHVGEIYRPREMKSFEKGAGLHRCFALR